MLEVLLEDRRVVVVGVGNPLRADDGVGPLVAARLAAALPGRVVDAGAAPETHVGAILEARPEVVLFVDAADHGGMPGSCCLATAGDLAARVPSTHAGGLALVARLLEAGGARCWLAGVQPGSLAAGGPMSPEVTAAGEALADALLATVRREAADA